jgi:trk system potassium uptake protein TrkH
MPVSINFWRCQLVWLGGMGLIVLAVAILPLLGIGGRQMFKAETPGPMKDSKMTPRMAETAKGLWVVYTLISICCALGYYWAGMTWLDAIMHMFSPPWALAAFPATTRAFGFFRFAGDRSRQYRIHADCGLQFRNPLSSSFPVDRCARMPNRSRKPAGFCW